MKCDRWREKLRKAYKNKAQLRPRTYLDKTKTKDPPDSYLMIQKVFLALKEVFYVGLHLKLSCPLWPSLP